MKLHAAILEGPDGPFAILRAHPDRGETPVTDADRRDIARCFKGRHNNIPVAFLADEPCGLRLLGYQDATVDLEQCVKGLSVPGLPWKDFDADT